MRLASVLLGSLMMISCSKPPSGGIMLAMRTDLRVPLGVAVVGVYILRVENGKSSLVSSSEVQAEYTENGEKRVRLPGTLAVESDGNPNVGVQVRIVAYDAERVPVAMREARVTVPVDALKVLPLPLLWMNTEDVADANPAAGGPVVTSQSALGFLEEGAGAPAAVDAFGRFRSDFCGDGLTLDDTGACAPIDIDVDALAPYAEPASTATGQGDETEATGTPGVKSAHGFCSPGVVPGCFDLDGCFPRNETELNFQTLEVAADEILGRGTPQCAVSLGVMAQLPGGIQVTDVALAVEADENDGATCIESGRCYIALDTASGAALQVGQGRIVLPPGVCRKATQNRVVRIAASPLCLRKRAEQEVCAYAEGSATRGICKDGSGWNGKGDPLPVASDAGEDAGAVCETVPNATGFWVGDNGYVTVATSDGFVRVYPAARVQGACLVGEPVQKEATNLVTGTPYRLLGSGNLVSLTAVSPPPNASGPSAALLVVDSTLAPQPLKIRQVTLPGRWSAGAFSDKYIEGGAAPAAAFAFTAGEFLLGTAAAAEFTTPLSASGPLPYSASSNLVLLAGVTQPPAPPSAAQLVMPDPRSLALRTTVFQPNLSTSYAFDTRPDSGALRTDVPIALARTTDGSTTAALVNRGDAKTILLGVTIGLLGSPPLLFEQIGAANMAPLPEMTLALATSGSDTYAYFATGGSIHYVKMGGGEVAPKTPVSGAATIHAVQVVGDSLYWLQSDSDQIGTLRRQPLTNGVLTSLSP